MPSKWAVTDPAERTVLQLDAKVTGKLLNPFHRTSLVVLDPHGHELYRLIDPRARAADRLLGAGPGDWAFVKGGILAARLVLLPRREDDSPTGVVGRIARMFSGSDRGLISLGPKHILAAPAILAIVAIHDELTNTSGA